MKYSIRIPHVILIVAVIAFFSSCQKEQQPLPTDQRDDHTSSLKNSHGKTLYGPTVPMGNGVARAWVSEDDAGNPVAVGINLSEKALDRLPAEPTHWVMEFHKNSATDFYTHLLVDWNPQGHEPPGVYDLPHFDFHFYIIPSSEREMIGPDDTVQFANAPAPQYVPPAYLQTPGGVPQMGAHWIDLLAPEFNGQTFTSTFIWGSYDGDFIFWEPMITRDFLLSKPDMTYEIRQPAAYEAEGWYGTHYQVSYSTRPNEYSIALINLQHHAGQ